MSATISFTYRHASFVQFLACSHSARARQYYNKHYIQPLLSIHDDAIAGRLALHLRGNIRTFIVAAFGQAASQP
jgi:hypothetical protein